MKIDRQAVFNKTEGKCAYCGCELKKGWHVDHIEPIRRIYKTIPAGYVFKGTPSEKWEEQRTILIGCENPEMDCIDNCLPACPSCNINKHSESLENFRARISQFVTSLNNYSVQYKIAKRYGLIQETNTPVTFYFETL